MVSLHLIQEMEILLRSRAINLPPMKSWVPPRPLRGYYISFILHFNSHTRPHVSLLDDGSNTHAVFYWLTNTCTSAAFN